MQPRTVLWAGLLLICAASPVVADAAVTVTLELPDTAVPADLHWGLKRDGRILTAGRQTVADARSVVSLRPAGDEPRSRLSNGPATLLLCINRDDLDSYNPSFGDLHLQMPIQITDGNTPVTVSARDWRERTVSDRANLLTVHYHRFDHAYPAAGLWTWDRSDAHTPQLQEVFAVGRDDYGVVFQIDTANYGRPAGQIGLIPRLQSDWRYKDGGDRFWNPRLGQRVYLLQGSNGVYRSAPDTSPKLVGATLDGPRSITVRFTHGLRPAAVRKVRVDNEDGTPVEVSAVTAADPTPDGRARAFVVMTREPLRLVGGWYRITLPDYEPQPVHLGRALAGQPFHQPDAILGASYAASGTTFGVFAPTADRVDVVLARTLTGEPDTTHALTGNTHGVWIGTVQADLAGWCYAYRLHGPGLDATRDVPDVYATCAQGLADRSLIVDLSATDPAGFDPSAYVALASPVDAVVYELHVRDLTSAADSGVKHKGRYLGLTEPGTHLPGAPDIATGLDHLVELGVTHVHLLPVQDFENEESADLFNWGYMTVFFNTPEGLYASTPVGDARIREFKQVVKAFHDRGIGVVLDVVYNHVSPSHSSFERTVPGYYLRRRPDGSLWNGSGCGNEFQSEYPMARKFIVDSLRYWVREFGVDGFRFDLLGLTDLETLTEARKALREVNPSILLYGEPWTGGESGIARVTDKEVIRGSGIAAFNDHFRDAIKGDRDGGAPGFIQTGARYERIMQGVGGAMNDWATAPTDVVTYCAAHDNLTLWDKIRQAAPDVPEDVQKRMQRFAGLLVLTSQGMPFLHAGQELCRTKGGNHNSYNASDAVNQIQWTWKRDNRDVFEYYKGLIALRKAHPVFRLRTKQAVENRLRLVPGNPNPRCIMYALNGRDLDGESASALLVLLNGHPSDQSFALPAGEWTILADADRAGTDRLGTATARVSLPPHSGMVLAR